MRPLKTDPLGRRAVRRSSPRCGPPRLLVTEEDAARLRTLVGECGALPGAEDAARLSAELDRATLVPRTQMPDDVVTMRSRVLLEVVETGKRREAVIVFPDEVGSSREHVSILSPVGMALLGLAVGDAIAWPVREGATTILRVVSVLYQPEAAGDFDP